MGYYVSLEEARFGIPADKHDEAFEICKRLNEETPSKYKRGGSNRVDPKTGENEAWFSWMPKEFDEYRNVEGILADLGFEVEGDEDDTLWLIGYDSKTGQEDVFINALAPLVEDGSYMHWRGEDGAQYFWEVKDGVLVQKAAQITWIDNGTVAESIERDRKWMEELHAKFSVK